VSLLVSIALSSSSDTRVAVIDNSPARFNNLSMIERGTRTCASLKLLFDCFSWGTVEGVIVAFVFVENTGVA
jgi:hypothetical protein